MALKKLAPSVKPKAAVKMPMPKAKAPGVKQAAGATNRIVNKGRKPVMPKPVKPRAMPMQPMQQPQQSNPGQSWAGILPGQVTGP